MSSGEDSVALGDCTHNSNKRGDNVISNEIGEEDFKKSKLSKNKKFPCTSIWDNGELKAARIKTHVLSVAPMATALKTIRAVPTTGISAVAAIAACAKFAQVRLKVPV